MGRNRQKRLWKDKRKMFIKDREKAKTTNITNPKAWEGEGWRCLPEQNRPLAGLNVLSLPLPSPAG